MRHSKDIKTEPTGDYLGSSGRERKLNQWRAVMVYREHYNGVPLSIICEKYKTKPDKVHKLIALGERLDSIW